MPYLVMKSGLMVFDIARAYGLAALLKHSDEDQSSSPVINDVGIAYAVDFPTGKPSKERLAGNTAWQSLFGPPDNRDPRNPAWNSLFVTDLSPNAKRSKIKIAKEHLETNMEEIITQAQRQGLMAQFEGETLPGGLEPAAFKGSKSITRAQYSEAQTKVDSNNWALACLGGALAGRYVWQRGEIFAIYPEPEHVYFSNWYEIREQTYSERLNYLSISTATAHYSVVLAKAMREKAAGQPGFGDRFSNLVYFSLFKTGNQWKPSAAGQLNLQLLLKLALECPHETAELFEVWEYLFRRGSVQGNEDMAEAITALIMNPSLESFEKHSRVLLRYIVRKEVKTMNLYTDEALKEVMEIVEAA